MTQYGVESHTDLLRRTEKRLQALERKPQGSLFWRGQYSSSAVYPKGSIVLLDGELWIAKRYTTEPPVTGSIPSDDWERLASSDDVLLNEMPQPTAETGWAVLNAWSWRVGSLAWVSIELERIGTDLLIPGDTNQPGQIGDTAICTIDADWWPSINIHAIYQTGYMSGGGTLYASDGRIAIRDGTPGARITQGHDLVVNFGPYVLASDITSIGSGNAYEVRAGGLELVNAKVYHNVPKAVVGTSVDAPLGADATNAPAGTPLTLDFTNPYKFPVKVRAVYQPHFYGYSPSTTYMKIVMDGVDAQGGDVNNTARKQYNGPTGVYYDEIYVEGIFTVPPLVTVTFEVVGRNTADTPTVNYGSLQAQMLGASGDGAYAQGVVWGRVRRTSNQTITRASGDQHIDFTEGVVEGGMAWDEDGLVVPDDGVYVAIGSVNAPYNQTGGGTNGHFTLNAADFDPQWCDTNTPNNNHRGTFRTSAHPMPLTAGTRIYLRINPMPADGTQITIESADLYVYRLADVFEQPPEPVNQSVGGSTTMSLNSGQAYGSTVTVDFGIEFSEAPFVVAGLYGAGDNKVSVKVETRTTTQAWLRLFHPTGLASANYTTGVHWIAVGPVA